MTYTSTYTAMLSKIKDYVEARYPLDQPMYDALIHCCNFYDEKYEEGRLARAIMERLRFNGWFQVDGLERKYSAEMSYSSSGYTLFNYRRI